MTQVELLYNAAIVFGAPVVLIVGYMIYRYIIRG